MNFGPKRLGSTIFYGGLYWASVESREFPTKVLIPKEPDAFYHEMAWLSFLRPIVFWIQLRVESSQSRF